MASEKIFLELVTKFKKAIRDFEMFSKKVTGTLSGVQEQFKKLNIFTGVFAANLASSLVTSSFNILKNAATDLFNVFITDGIKAARVTEDALNLLNTALAQAGSFSEEASQQFQDFARNIQRTTTISRQSALQFTALARNFTDTNEQARELVTAAFDLSKATGLPLEGSIKQLGKTLSGLTGELGESVGAVRGLTAAELKAFKGIQIVGARFINAARDEVRTFSGSIKQLNNEFNDFQGAVGETVTNNKAFVNVIREVSKIISELTDAFKKNTELQDDITKAFIGISDAVIFLSLGFSLLERKITRTFTLLSGSIKLAVANIEALALAQKGEFSKAFDIIKNEAKDFAEDLNKTITKDTFFEKIAGGFKRIRDSLKEGLGSKNIKEFSNATDVLTETLRLAQEELKRLAVLGVALVRGFEQRNPGLVLARGFKSLDAALKLSLINQAQFNNASKLLQEDFEKLVAENTKKDEDLRVNTALKQIEELKAQNELLTLLDEEANAEKIDRNQQLIDEIAAQQLEGTQAALKLQIEAEKKKQAAQKKSDDLFIKQQDTFLSTAATLSQDKNRELALIGRAAGITQIAIKTPPAVASSFEFGTKLGGPPLGFIFAGIAGVAMAAQAARLAATPLQTGGLIPGGFPNDTFPARLTSGERVLSVQQNQDFERFVNGNENTNMLLGVLISKIDRLESSVVVNIGDSEVLNSVQRSIDGGRVLEVG